MKKRFNILVTGAGALLGQGILRLLKVSKFNLKIHTCDPDIMATGHWLGDYAMIVPLANSTNYKVEIKKIVSEFQIDFIFVGTDVELIHFAELYDELKEGYNCRVIVSNLKSIQIANDKFLTAQFLKKNNFPFPLSGLANSKDDLEVLNDQLSYPMLAKPIDGARSMGIVIIRNKEQLDNLYSSKSNLVVQELLSESEGEFTAGCVVLDGKCRAVVTLKRELRDGNTVKTFYDQSFEKYNAILSKIAELLEIEGPVNFQFRIRNDQPVIFEINCRFSGTTPVRYFYGFNEVEAMLEYYIENKIPNVPKLKSGHAFRVISDIFISANNPQMFKGSKFLEGPQSKQYNYNLE